MAAGALALAGPVLTATATADAATISSTASSAGYGWLRLAHLSPNTPPVDVYLYSFGHSRAMIVLRHVAYGTVSPYERVASGDYTVAMRGVGAAPSSKPVLSATVDVSAGNAYTVAGMGPFKALRLQVLHDQLVAPQGRALIQVIQASLHQQRVTVSLGSHPVASNLAFAKVTGFRAVAPGRWAIRAAGTGQDAATRLTLAAGTIHTVVVLDQPGHLAIRVLTDAAGSARVPAGGAATGRGGTAAQPRPALAPWLAAALCGLAMIAAGLTRRHWSRPAHPSRAGRPAAARHASAAPARRAR
jgi:Domain of unknown function (DUF4397)